jgi:hypothetical protein
MLVSARGAAEIIQGVDLGREEVRRLLQAGLAGPGLRTPGAVLYDEERVRELATWPPVREAVIDELCPFGLFVGRVARGRSIDLAADWTIRSTAVAGGWDLSIFDRVLLTSRIARFGPMPFLATLCGYVAMGAEVVDLEVEGGGRTRFGLAEPGEWYEAFGKRRLRQGAGRSFFIWGWSRRYRE